MRLCAAAGGAQVTSSRICQGDAFWEREYTSYTVVCAITGGAAGAQKPPAIRCARRNMGNYQYAQVDA